MKTRWIVYSFILVIGIAIGCTFTYWKLNKIVEYQILEIERISKILKQSC